MKFKNIIAEALVDDLPIKKIEKAILKDFHKELRSGIQMNGPETSAFLSDTHKKFAMDMHFIVKLYFTYLKYKDFLFSEEGIEMVEDYDTTSEEIVDTTDYVITKYFYDNYRGKEVQVNHPNLSVTISFMEDFETTIIEEMGVDVQVRFNVDAGDENDNFFGSLFLTSSIQKDNYGFDLLNFNEEAVGDWLIHNEGRQHSDVVDSGKIRKSFLPPPKNLSEPEIKKFCDKWVEIAKRIVNRNIPLFERYYDHVHGEDIYESKIIKK